MKSINLENHTPAAIMTIALLAALSTSLQAAEVSVTYRFGEPRVVQMERGFTLISFPGCVQSGQPGEPSYPYHRIAILLPPGEAVSTVHVDRRGWRQLDGSYLLHPMQLPVPLQESEHREHTFLHKEEAYLIDRWVEPPDPRLSTQHCRGHAIAVGSFSPAGYRPLSGSVGYYREIEITVRTITFGATAQSHALFRTDKPTHERIAALVDNPGDLARYAETAGTATTPDDYEYLIVTRDSLRDAFAPFRDFHTRRGLRTHIMSVEEIESSFTGVDTAERIRNAIIHEYTNCGITHILLGGDADGAPGSPKVVPYRGLYCAVQDHESLYEEYNMPADIYFAALDGNWNTDGDELWGEPDEEDFYAEIVVGRACVQTSNEVTRFINKTMLYQETPVSGQVRRALLLGEKLWDSPETWGADELEEYVGTCTANDITTTGIPTDFDTANLFDRDIYYWDKYDALDAINAGTHWVPHSGHCQWNSALRFYLNDVTDTKFTNDGVNANFIIVATAGCYAASFDNRGIDGTYYVNSDCIAEKMLKIQHCAIAFRGNSRFGWLDPGTTNSTSHLFLREFYDAVFTEGYHTLGEADRRSRDELVPYIGLSEPQRAAEFRWDIYNLNLLGDPALDAWTDTPCSLTVSHPAVIGRYDESIEMFTPFIPGSRATLYHDGVCYGRGVGTPVGYIVLHRLLPFPDSLDAIELNVSAHNHYTYRDTIAIDGTADAAETMPRIALMQNVPNPFNPSTVIRFSLDREGPVDLRVYDIAGREVDRLVRRRLPAGVHTVTWRPTRLASGVYIYILRAREITLSRKAVLLR